MKLYLYITLILSLSFNAYADQTTSVRLNYGAADAHQAYGVALIENLGNPKPMSPIFSLGLSINKIKSNLDLANYGRKTIYPVYFLGKLSFNYTVSPFAEFGFDLGDAIIDDLVGSDDPYENFVDTYYSLGLMFRMGKKYGVSLYYKNYDIKYFDTGSFVRKEVDLDMTGISFTVVL